MVVSRSWAADQEYKKIMLIIVFNANEFPFYTSPASSQ